MRTAPFVTLYKLGGSLLDLPDLPRRLEGVFAQRPGTLPLLVVGGGAAADLVRAWDRIHRLGDERAHWLALRAMQLNEALVAALLPNAVVVADREGAAAAWDSQQAPILSALPFVEAEEGAIESGDACADPIRRADASTLASAALPRTWDVTSDSIAAWIALRWRADELVLLKSTPPPDAPGSNAPVVDAHFPALAASLPHIGYVDLRAARPTITTWAPK